MNSSRQLNPLPFDYWPFDLVPSPDKQVVWADRQALLQQINRLGRRLGRHEAVTLHLLWADFGAGKTHSLLYLKQQVSAGTYGEILPLYSALPKGCKAFLDIYRAIVRAIDVRLVQGAFEKAGQTVGNGELERVLSATWPNLGKAVRAIAIGSDVQQTAALAWLHAEANVPQRELQALSIFGRIRSTDDAVLALCGLVRLFNLAGYRRVLIMVDEFQRVETLRRAQQDEINAGLHGFFNAAGKGMSLLLSFSFGVEENIKHFLNRELLSRVDPLRLSIPQLTNEEAAEFLNDVVERARVKSGDWPVAAAVNRVIADEVSKRYKPTPRRLIKAAGLVYELAGLDMEDGALDILDTDYVKRLVEDGAIDRLDDGDEE